MRASTAALRRTCLLALLVFLAAAVPFRWYCVEPFARTVLAASAFLARLSGPEREIVRAHDGRTLEFDRRSTLGEFFADPEQRPRSYGLLALWAWIAVAPLRSFARRLRLAALGTGVLAATYAIALSVSAVGWYRSAVTAEVGGGGGGGTSGLFLEALGSGLSIVALFVAPLVLAVVAFPGVERPAGDA